MGFSRQEYWSGVPLPSPIKLFKEGLFKEFLQAGRQGTGKSHECGSPRQIQAKELPSPPRSAGVQPRLIQGIRSKDGVGDLFNYSFIKDIKSNRMRIAQ